MPRSAATISTTSSSTARSSSRKSWSAFTATRAHWSDVGGKASVPGQPTRHEIFQEGVQFDTLKVVRRGELEPEVVRMIEANVRFPTNRSATCARRSPPAVWRAAVRRVVEKYGYGRFDRQSIASGSVGGAGPLGDRGDSRWSRTRASASRQRRHRPRRALNVEVAVTVEGSGLTIDLTGTHDQVPGPDELRHLGRDCGGEGRVQMPDLTRLTP